MELGLTHAAPPDLRVERGRPGRGPRAADVAVVMDVLRMTTTAAVLMRRCSRVAVAATLDDLPQLEQPLSDLLLVSELADADAWGARIDNSPVAASEVDLGSRTPVLITTNGTQALLAAAACAPEVLLASFVDLYAVARHLAESATTRVLLMPAGQVARGEACVEDDLCADALAALLAGREPDLQAASRIIRADPLVRQRIEVEPCFGIDLEVALAPQPSQRALQFEALGRGVGHILRVA